LTRSRWFLICTTLVICLLTGILWLLRSHSTGDNPAVSLIFTSNLMGSSLDLYQMDVLGRRYERLTDVALIAQPAFIYDSACSPTGDGDVLFSAAGMTWRMSVYQSSLALIPALDDVQHVRWSPDGLTLAGYLPQIAPDFEAPRLVTVNSDGGLTVLADAGFSVSDVLWAGDGDHLIVSLYDPAGNWSIIRQVRIPDAEISVLTELRGYVRDLDWSAQAERFVFTLTQESQTDVYTMHSDGSDQQRLTGSGFDGYPMWSPDGRFISFSSNRDGTGFQIYLMTADGTDQRRLTGREFDGRDSFNRCWLPRL
jgi:hypothetical protein